MQRVALGWGTWRNTWLQLAHAVALNGRSTVQAALPLLVPARLRQHVTIVMGAAVAILTLRLWLVAPLPGLLLSAGGLAALVAAVQAVRSRAAAASR